MSRWPFTLAAASAFLLPADAAVIRGIVVENQTGHPLARTLVVAAPVAGTSGGAKSTRTDLYGGFVFESMPAGAFLISAARKGFATIHYGQKQWKSAGLPVILEENQRMQVGSAFPAWAPSPAAWLTKTTWACPITTSWSTVWQGLRCWWRK